MLGALVHASLRSSLLALPNAGSTLLPPLLLLLPLLLLWLPVMLRSATSSQSALARCCSSWSSFMSSGNSLSCRTRHTQGVRPCSYTLNKPLHISSRKAGAYDWRAGCLGCKLMYPRILQFKGYISACSKHESERVSMLTGVRTLMHLMSS